MLSLRNLIWAIIILCLSYCNVYCFTPSRQNVVNLPSILPGSVNFQSQQQQQQQQQQHKQQQLPLQNNVEDTERAVYDPGDDLLKMFNSVEIPDDYLDVVNNNELELNNIHDKNDFLRKLEEDMQNDQDIISKSAIMMKFLEDPNIDTLPIIYVEEPSHMLETSEDGIDMNQLLSSVNVAKRSRYYRRYPWKRHNKSRGQYEADARFLCVPSKDDVLKLLVGLHQNRNGNQQKTVTFCNRKRPAKAIFTNIRFLG